MQSLSWYWRRMQSMDGPEIQQAWRNRLIEKADQILNNRLSYFDLETVHHGDPINWHRDFSTETNAKCSMNSAFGVS